MDGSGTPERSRGFAEKTRAVFGTQPRLYFDTVLMGVVGGLAARLFMLLLHDADWFFMTWLAHYQAPGLPGEGSAGEVVSPVIAIPPGAAYILSFRLRGEGEPPDTAHTPCADALVVSIADTDDGVMETLFDASTHGNSVPDWTWFVATVSRHAGSSVRIHVVFDTYDGVANRYAGWWLDDLVVRSVCGPGVCDSDDDCRDSNGCTPDRCAPFENPTNTSGFCEPGLATCRPCVIAESCESGEACVDGVCAAAP